VIKGSPALENGILQGDIVIEANGNKLQDLSLQDAVNFIK
jgi:C-terminal processing protease CtpA/Prc